MKKIVIISLTALLITGCASGIDRQQKLDYDLYKAKGLAQEEKNPTLGAALGILPGGGSFYGREYGLGIVNLLTWPLSILWDPISGINAAERINYVATKQYVSQQKTKETNRITQSRIAGEIDDSMYRSELIRISQKYDLDPLSAPIIMPQYGQQSTTVTPTPSTPNIEPQKSPHGTTTTTTTTTTR